MKESVFQGKMTLAKKVQSLKVLCITAFPRFIKFCIYERECVFEGCLRVFVEISNQTSVSANAVVESDSAIY